jgi:cell division protein FtsN
MKQILHAEMTRNMFAVKRRLAKRAMSSIVAALIVATIVATIVGIGLLVVHAPQTQAANTTQNSDPANQSQVTYPSGVPTTGPGADGNLTGVCDNTTNYYYSYYC